MKTKPFYAKLHNQVIAAIALAIVVGALWPNAAVQMKPLGDAFIKLISMMIAPLVFCMIVSGISHMGSAGRLARITVKSLVYFCALSTVALLLGVAAANLISTGSGLHADAHAIDMSGVVGSASVVRQQGVVPFLLNIIPSTVVGAFAQGAVLQVMLISLLVGLALSFLGERARIVRDLVDELTRVVFRIIDIIIKLSPVGAFGAMAFSVGRFGLHALLPLMKLVLLFYGSCGAFALLLLVPISRAVGFSLGKFCRYILEEILLFLSIANSEALLPSLMEKLERIGVSKPVVGFVVPTGYSLNLAGSCIYFGLAVMFIAQATHTPLSLERQLVFVTLATLLSVGAVGFTSSSFIVLAGTLAALPYMPIAGLALLFGIEPFMSRGRGLVNYIGNGVAAIAIAAWENEVDIGELNRRLAAGPDEEIPGADEAPTARSRGASAAGDSAAARTQERNASA